MYLTEANLLSVLLATIASMAVGMVWYSPLLFGAQWVKLMNIDPRKFSEMKKGRGKSYLLSSFANLIQAFVLALMIYAVGSRTLLQHVLLAFWLWLGFIFTTFLTQVIFEGKKPQLFLLSVAYQLASMVTMAAVIWLT